MGLGSSSLVSPQGRSGSPSPAALSPPGDSSAMNGLCCPADTLAVFELGLPRWLSGKEPACQCRRCGKHGFNPWVGKILWSKEWQHTLVFLPGESHGWRNLAGCDPEGRRESDAAEHVQRPRFVCDFSGKSSLANFNLQSHLASVLKRS